VFEAVAEHERMVPIVEELSSAMFDLPEVYTLHPIIMRENAVTCITTHVSILTNMCLFLENIEAEDLGFGLNAAFVERESSLLP
jgi:hypothetical protein